MPKGCKKTYQTFWNSSFIRIPFGIWLLTQLWCLSFAGFHLACECQSIDIACHCSLPGMFPICTQSLSVVLASIITCHVTCFIWTSMKSFVKDWRFHLNPISPPRKTYHKISHLLWEHGYSLEVFMELWKEDFRCHLNVWRHDGEFTWTCTSGECHPLMGSGGMILLFIRLHDCTDHLYLSFCHRVKVYFSYSGWI